LNKKEFIERVEAQAPPDLKGTSFLKNAIEHNVNREGEMRTNPYELIRDTMSLARRIKMAPIREAEERNNALTDENSIVTAQDLLFSDNLIQKILPWTENLRKAIFESVEPPFQHNLIEAEKWLKEEEQKNRGSIISEERNEAFNIIEDIARKHSILLNFTNETLPYFDGKSEYTRIVVALPKTYLYKLAKEVKRVSKATGFSPASLTMYVLTGLKPIIPRTKVTKNLTSTLLTNEEQIRRTSISIDINVADLTFEELKALYDKYRSLLNIKRKTPISDEQAQFYRFVKSQGEPIKGKGSTAFWKQIQQKWNESNPDNQLRDGTVAYNKFKRIEKKMNL
jgi:hypothetical protein